ncbi:hypothetical protein CGLO_01696 [Colletotrichum gloeosporioides Cg-14]|uniref:DUF7908 domain-containing protein n=1 Tax=Colletotrichum gloeosporioides (strain Cg-14) TaxID=1237896 RepID=T0M3H6_COLGC|nr:hypothetical protein CGLO_01696 [Colletotrichum gloeosporioides Cg-14]
MFFIGPRLHINHLHCPSRSSSVAIRVFFNDRIGVNSRVHSFRDLCNVRRVRRHIARAIYKPTYPRIFDTNRVRANQVHTSQLLISSTAAEVTSYVPSTTVAISELSGSFAITTSPPVSTTSVIPGNRLIFLIAPAPPERTKRIRKRDLGGFISTGLDENPPTCDQASVCILNDAQELFTRGIPLYYDVGYSFRQLRSTSNPPTGAATRGFATANGLLVFQNPALPNGEASFYQNATSGQPDIGGNLEFQLSSQQVPTSDRLPTASSTLASEAQISSTTFRTLSLFFPNTTLQDSSLARTSAQTTPLTPVPSSRSSSILAPISSQGPFSSITDFRTSISKLSFIFFSILCPNYIYINSAIIFYSATNDVIIVIIYSLINDIFCRVCYLSLDIVLIYSHISATFNGSVHDANNIVCHPIDIIFLNIHIYVIFSILLLPDDSYFFYFTYVKTQ